MRIQNSLAIALAGVLLSGISALPGVKTDYEHNLDFARYHTYSWGKVQAANSLWDARIKQAVDGQLAAKGWTEVPSGAEVVVAARDAIHDQQELNTFYDGFGGRRFGGFGTATTTVDTEKVGPLIVEMFDGQSKNLIWHASATNTLSSNPDKNIKTLDNNVHKMFEHFPPEPKK